MALRETRGSRARLTLYMAAIAAGVASLVAIGSFRENVTRTVRSQARTVLGADLEVRHRNDFPDTIVSVLDSLKGAGIETTESVNFGSMVLAESGNSRLLQVRGIDGGFPYYGDIESVPASAWSEFQASRAAVVDEAVLVYLDAEVGDTISIGETEFVIAGYLRDFPGDLGVRAAVGPRVFIPLRYIEETRLLRFGSVATHRVYFRWDDGAAVQNFVDQHNSLLVDNRVGRTTVEDVEDNLGNALENLTRFLGLVGLIALILGGLGVASGVHVFVKEKLDTIAVLRCLGARHPTVFRIYLLQAGMIGLGGAMIGAILGLAIQVLLPTVLGEFLPLDIEVTTQWGMVAMGLFTGVWTSMIFALFPLLKIRGVSPLSALRKDFTPKLKKRPIARTLAFAALVASIVGISVWQAPSPAMGVAFAVAIGIATGILAVAAWGTTHSAKRFFPRRARYVIRQGVANLFRPQNQTISVVLVLGFGMFILTTLGIVQRSLLEQFSVDTDSSRPNLVFFDVQSDQREALTRIMESHGLPRIGAVPIVPARMSRVNDLSVEEILSDTTTNPNRWMYRREYRHTYRDSVTSSETITAGLWFDEADSGELPRISLDEDIAEGLEIGLGDRITWNVQGVDIETRIASLRRINWARFEPNFFAIFEPGVLDQAPQTFVYLTRSDSAAQGARAQREVVENLSNVAVVDLGLIQNTIDGVVTKISYAVKFMALFSMASGLVVLVGAIATTRYQRVQESALLRTLGASARQVRQMIATEYLALGLAAGTTGIGLAVLAGWGLTHFVFEISVAISPVWLGLSLTALALTTVVVGALNSRGVTRNPPLATLRELSE